MCHPSCSHTYQWSALDKLRGKECTCCHVLQEVCDYCRRNDNSFVAPQEKKHSPELSRDELIDLMAYGRTADDNEVYIGHIDEEFYKKL